MTGNETILQYLNAVPAWYLATSVDGQPHVRPFSFAAEENGKIWFCTATTKDVWQELLENQRFEATSWWPGHGWLILRGKAGLKDKAGAEMRRAGYEHLESLGEHYDGPDDETLVFFSVEEPQAWICDHDEWKPIEAVARKSPRAIPFAAAADAAAVRARRLVRRASSILQRANPAGGAGFRPGLLVFKRTMPSATLRRRPPIERNDIGPRQAADRPLGNGGLTKR